ncbi:hypothetical protein P280DRAFT_525275 [Massarina eburnea CBS 473.64]|uniref:Chitin-binding type-4 domain-containing protein n=1 Tax=Massarina eburnea CBS 473.64 TaxID=1395130 RepID=A0A6A6SIE5_9PLEO|nr:hypothetical protein P280DRAFT_525275 [Massarina eburnea CBS 473.64]
MLSSIASIVLLAPAVLAHGIITSPAARAPGAALTSACGTKITTAQKQDNTSYVEQLTKLATTSTDYNASQCNLFLCKGLQFADNSANVQTWKAGQVVPIKVSMRIPHLGSANVSIVDTKANTVVGALLKDWPSGYSPGTKESDIPIEQRQFNITVPSGLETTCANAGDCVLQWWWLYNNPVIVETFESCVDFKIAPAAYGERSFNA